MNTPRILIAATLLVAGSARAQDLSPPVEGSAHTKLSGQLGGNWSSGNSKSFSANVQARLSHRGGLNEITWSGIANYGIATAPLRSEESDADAPQHEFKTDTLYYTRLRYDRFITPHDSLFVGMVLFRDTSSGFRARYSPYAGYQHTWIGSESFELWTELGYRVAREFLFLDREARAEGLSDKRWVHGPLLGVGFSWQLNDTIDLDFYVEAQQSLNISKDFRLVNMTNLTNRIGRGFSLGMNFNARYLLAPIGAREPLDTQLQVVAILDQSFGEKK